MIEYTVTVDSDGNKSWFLNGKLHREDDPAIEYANGDNQWYINGKRHRIDGPAIEYANGDNQWYINGKRHRIDGPAIEKANGDKEWYLNGERYSETEFNKIINKSSSCDEKIVEIDTNGMQETPEEAAEKEFPLLELTNHSSDIFIVEENLQLLGHRKSFIKGANWLAKRIHLLMDEYQDYLLKTNESVKTFKEWFEKK